MNPYPLLVRKAFYIIQKHCSDLDLSRFALKALSYLPVARPYMDKVIPLAAWIIIPHPEQCCQNRTHELCSPITVRKGFCCKQYSVQAILLS